MSFVLKSDIFFDEKWSFCLCFSSTFGLQWLRSYRSILRSISKLYSLHPGTLKDGEMFFCDLQTNQVFKIINNGHLRRPWLILSLFRGQIWITEIYLWILTVDENIYIQVVVLKRSNFNFFQRKNVLKFGLNRCYNPKCNNSKNFYKLFARKQYF